MKTLKREEVDGRAYRDAADARGHISTFMEDVYNRQRLHSALTTWRWATLKPRWRRAGAHHGRRRGP